MPRKTVDLVSVADAASHYSVHPRTIHKLIDAGKIRPFRIGPKVLRIDLTQTDALFQWVPEA